MTRRRPRGALLAAAALALLLSACTAGTPNDRVAQATDAPAAAEPTPTPSATPTPTPEAPEIVAVDPTEYDLADSPMLASMQAIDHGDSYEFDSPSGNLHCGIYDMTSFDYGFLYGCRIDEKDWSFSDESPSDYCHGMEVRCGWGIESMDGEVPRPLAKSDATYSMHPDDWVLPYGTSIAVGPIVCESTEVGVTCRDAGEHGFTISKSLNETW